MIVVECHRDQALIYRIGFTPGQVRHAHNKSRVLWTVEKRQKAIGIIDEDPDAGCSKYLREYDERSATGEIKLLIRKDDDGSRIIRRAIQISPRLEDWLYGIAKRNKISPSGFGLPDDAAEMHDRSLKGDKDFRRFLIELVKKKDDEINALRRWIRQAIE